jgi:non-homologous end joining protein Ku
LLDCPFCLPDVKRILGSIFHLLHAGCGQRISYAKYCAHHGPVEADAVAKGYEYATDQYVIVDPEELEQLRPPRDKALVLEQFVPSRRSRPPSLPAAACTWSLTVPQRSIPMACS